MSPYLRFESSFWSQQNPSASIPDFSAGLNVLHHKLAQSRVENDEIISFLKDRIAVEELYGARLSELSKTKSNAQGFLRDEGAGLRRSFESLKGESEELSLGHKQLAINITELVLNPLTRFTDNYKRKVTTGKANMDLKLKQFEHLAREMDKARALYQKKCREADAAEENALRSAAASPASPASSPPASDQTPTFAFNADPTTPPAEDDYRTATVLQLGDRAYNATELEAFLRRMRAAVHTTDYKTQLLGTYHNVSSGADISRWLQENHPAAENTVHGAETLGQQLVASGMLKLVSARGSKFQASATAWYQWKSREDDASSVASTPMMGGLFERFGSIGVANGGNGSDFEPAYKRIRREAEKADEAYRNAVKRVDGMRMGLEEILFAHFAEMEHAEFDRINFIKQGARISPLFAFLFSYSFINLAATMSNTIPAAQAICDRMLVYQEALRPEHDVQFIVEQYRTGGFAPKPILYENHYHGTAIDQIFGVSIDDITRASRSNIPNIVTETIAAIEREKKMIWTTPIPLDRVHAVRTELNSGSESITTDRLRPFDPLLLAGVMRLYFRELPECLLTVELYDDIKILYSSGDQDEELRLASISNLIATLPSANFHTIDTLLSHLHRIVKDTADPENPDDDTLVTALSHSLGPILLRPRVETPVNVHDKHPHRLLKDLIRRHDFVFSDTARKSHQENVRRRSFIPLKADESSIAIMGLPSPGAEELVAPPIPEKDIPLPVAANLHPAAANIPTDKSIKRRSLMAFMSRSSIVVDDAAKRGVSSVLGIITNRTSTSSTSSSEGGGSLPTPLRSSADVHASPSSIFSPIMSPSPPPPVTPTSPIIPVTPRTFSTVIPEPDEEPYEKTFGAHITKATEEAVVVETVALVEDVKQTMTITAPEAVAAVTVDVVVTEAADEVNVGVETARSGEESDGEHKLDPFFDDE
ncbi:hypothetical protein BC936DRAFT_146208 [Jimgerdemannia flammicorona]|uniref:Rho-GAP domain-containing protein n=1 Tax=Jimgerdemannia flammicorona TaxID=994334 RepID=A0A433D828_9FUNG|nr:hypothetical protein BC936DRAFT_146208 [Jimgerdemannia flammicorona]